MLSYTQNRELSWLKFNERVLNEAEDKTVPLYERLKFLSIFCSNLDEFFMVRVGTLSDAALMDSPPIDNKTGWTPSEQLEKIYSKTEELSKKRDKVYVKIREELLANGIEFASFKGINKIDKRFLDAYFRQSIFPVLSPQIIDPAHPFPHIPNKTLNIIVMLKKDDNKFFGMVSVPASIERLVYINKSFKIMFIEKIIFEYTDTLFTNYEVLEKAIISVTRNADINYDDESSDMDEDYRMSMKKLLKKRNLLTPVRLETMQNTDSEIISFLQKKLGLTSTQTFRSKTPLDMSFVYKLPERFNKYQKARLCYEQYTPQIAKSAVGYGNITRLVKKKDILIHYPYESIDTFLYLIKEASVDKNVLSVKITIYRLASNAKIVEYLCNAAENKKEVIVIMELRARFDEQNNIDFSRQLEDAGCKIYYGFDDFKVHSKICLITYANKGRISYITQIGTGNYNEKTAKLYTDLSVITSDPEIGRDADTFFKNMLVSNLKGSYKHLLVAPSNLKARIFELIDDEIQKAKDDNNASIIMKMNSLTELDTIEKLREASKAGVKIFLIIRGICCLLPGVAGETQNITVISVVGKYLEHHRIFAFGSGKDMKIFISSSDLMTRNLNRRVEIACPVLDSEVKKTVFEILRIIMFDNVKARVLMPDGNYERVTDTKPEPFDSQSFFEKNAKSNKLKENSVFYKIFLNIIEIKNKALKNNKFFRG